MGSKGQQYALHLHVPHTIIRPAQPKDEDGIAKVCTEGQYFTYKDIYTKEEIEKIIEKYYTPARISKEIEDVTSEWNGYYVAEIEGEIVGAIGGGMTNPNVAEIYVMYLHPERRNQLIGSKLLNAYTELQKSEYQANEQWVSVAKHNDKGLPFYEAKGFTFVEEQVSYEMDPERGHISLRYKRMLL
jgi:ribosomal protein S18 acetylase RimI-like enzyme